MYVNLYINLFTCLQIYMSTKNLIFIFIIININDEMNDSVCKCFTGRMSRLVNVLNGFDEIVIINISKNQRIWNIIIITKMII